MRSQALSAPGNNATIYGNAAVPPAATRGWRLVSVVREAPDAARTCKSATAGC